MAASLGRLVGEDEPMGGATGLTQGSVGIGPFADPSQEPTEAGRAANAPDPLEQRESSKPSRSEGTEEGSGDSSAKCPRHPVTLR
jgi:hypothetical protein